jgi:hypothetical protein
MVSKIVLYAYEDFEPITFIKVPFNERDLLNNYRPFFRVPIIRPVTASFIQEHTPSISEANQTVDIEVHKIKWRGINKLIFTTKDEEAALLLKSDVMAGQRSEYQENYRKGFDDGLIMAIGAVLK